MRTFTASGRVSARGGAERSGATKDVAELALAHVVGGAVERSYAGSDLFDQRRRLMDRWAAFVAGSVPTRQHAPRRRKRTLPLVASGRGRSCARVVGPRFEGRISGSPYIGSIWPP